jgi:quinol monooxygenase YgiN
MSSELFIFARFHAREGLQEAVAATIQEVLQPTRQEPGCLSIHAYSAIRDPRLFYVHSHWKDEAAFDHHAQLPHTVRFVEKIQSLIDHPLDVVRTSRSV